MNFCHFDPTCHLSSTPPLAETPLTSPHSDVHASSSCSVDEFSLCGGWLTRWGRRLLSKIEVGSCPEIPLCPPAPMADPPWQCLCGVRAQPSQRAFLGVPSPGVLYLSILVDVAQTQKGQRSYQLRCHRPVLLKTLAGFSFFLCHHSCEIIYPRDVLGPF